MRRAALVLLAALVPAPAPALTCIAQDAALFYTIAAGSDARFVAIHGAFRGDPVTGQASRPFRLEGKALTADGFTRAFSAPVTFEPGCIAEFCGPNNPGTGSVLAFVEVVPGGYRLTAQPCGTSVIWGPTARDLARVVACHRGEACEPGS